MPKVRFNVNLGRRDASAIGLDFADCAIGSTQDVSDEQLEVLKRLGPGVCSEDVPPVPKGKRAGEEPAMQVEEKAKK